MKLLRSKLLLVLAFTSITSVLHAQPNARSFTLGTGLAGDRLRNFKGGPVPTIDATLDFRKARRRQISFLIGAFGGASTPIGDDDVCYLEANGGCKMNLPMLAYLGAQVGVEARAGKFAISTSAGPGVFRADGDSKVTGRIIGGRAEILHYSTTAFAGVNAHADATFYFTERFGMTTSVRSAYLPNFRGTTLQMAGATLGVRIE